MCWIIGEYASKIVTDDTIDILNDYHETLELFAYERMSLVKLGLSNIDESGKKIFLFIYFYNILASIDQKKMCFMEEFNESMKNSHRHYITRLMLIVISSLTKLAAK